MSADVVVTTSVDFTGIERILLNSERRVLQRNGQAILRFIRTAWTGWSYVGRPKKAPRNVSMRAWRRDIETTEDKAVLRITNRARDWRTGIHEYVAYVRRKKGADPEYLSVFNDVEAEFIPRMRQELIDEVNKNVGAPKRARKLRDRTSTTTQTLLLER
jgi:hypothetical protein